MTTTAFSRHLALFDGDIARIVGVMRANLGDDIPLIADMENDYLVGGKRVRAIVALLAGRLCGLDQATGDQAAAAIEFIHTATLLHDDVIDDAPTRRHLPTAARAYGNAAAVLAGDFLYSRASQMLAALNSAPLLRRIADATNKLSQGEILQLSRRGQPDTDEAAYYNIINLKTANLFSAAAAAAAVLTGAKAEPSLSAYGRRLGRAFQLIDDCLDYVGDDGDTGKKIGADFNEGKMTLPAILALASVEEKTRRRLAEGWRRRRPSAFAQILRLARESGALGETRARAQAEAERAAAALDSCPPGAARDALSRLAETAPARLA